MMDTNVLAVDEDEEFADVDLPELFLEGSFDRDRDRAGEAAEELDGINSDLVRILVSLELIERALRQAERNSARARLVRVHLRRALSGFDELFRGLDDARCSFLFHW